MPKDSLGVSEVTIKTDDGTFTAPTLRKAKAMARKAALEADKKRYVPILRYEITSLRAKMIAWVVTKRKHETTDGKVKGYDLVSCNHKDFATLAPRSSTASDGTPSGHTLGCRNGCIDFRVGKQLQAVVVGPNGYVDLVVLDSGDRLEIYALGAEGESYSGEFVPTVTANDFPVLAD